MSDIIVFAPHQDDEAFSCAGAIAIHVAAGDGVTIVFTTDGRESSNPLIEGKYTPDELASLREKEAVTAARAMGVSPERVTFFRYHDQDLDNPAHHGELLDRISAVVQERGPSVVYLAMTNYNHADHRATFFGVFEALERLRFQGEVRVSHVHSVFSAVQKRPRSPAIDEAFERVDRTFPVTGTITIDISKAFDQKYQAITAHESQMGMFVNLVAPGDDLLPALKEIFDDVYRDRIETFDVRRLAAGSG